MNSTVLHLLAMKPEEFGWKINDNGNLKLVWFKGDAAPSSIEEIVEQDENEDLDNEVDETELTDDEYESEEELEDE